MFLFSSVIDWTLGRVYAYKFESICGHNNLTLDAGPFLIEVTMLMTTRMFLDYWPGSDEPHVEEPGYKRFLMRELIHMNMKSLRCLIQRDVPQKENTTCMQCPLFAAQIKERKKRIQTPEIATSIQGQSTTMHLLSMHLQIMAQKNFPMKEKQRTNLWLNQQWVVKLQWITLIPVQ